MVKPLGTRLLIERVIEKEKRTASGLVVAPGSNVAEDIMPSPQSLKCSVLAVGDEVRTIRVGDTVLVSQFGPTEAKEFPFDKTLIVAEEDVLAVIVPDKVAE